MNLDIHDIYIYIVEISTQDEVAPSSVISVDD